MDEATLLELARAIPSVVTACTAIYGVYIAKKGLDKWHRETIGKRRVELAEEVLAGFYEVREIIDWARFPGIIGPEGNSRPRGPSETGDKSVELDMYYVPVERLNKKAEFYSRFQSHKYRFAAIFGKESAKPFDDVHAVRTEVITAARMLNLVLRREREEGDESALKRKRQWEDKIGLGVDEEDVLAMRLSKAVEDIEKLCRPVIDEGAKGRTKEGGGGWLGALSRLRRKKQASSTALPKNSQ